MYREVTGSELSGHQQRIESELQENVLTSSLFTVLLLPNIPNVKSTYATHSKLFPPRSRTEPNSTKTRQVDFVRFRVGIILSLYRLFPRTSLARSTPTHPVTCPLPQTRTSYARIRQRIDFSRFTRCTLSTWSTFPTEI